MTDTTHPSPAEEAGIVTIPPRRKPNASRSMKRSRVERLLTREDLDEFQLLLRGPYCTIMELGAWVRARGYTLPNGALLRYRRQFDQRLSDVTKAAESAIEYSLAAQAAGVRGSISISDAALLRFHHLHFNKLFKMESADELSAKEWLDLLNAIDKAVTISRRIEEAQPAPASEKKNRRRASSKKADDAGKQPHSATDAEAEAAAAGPELVERMRRILNL